MKATILNFKVDSHVSGRMAATAGRSLDNVFDLKAGDVIEITPGSTPDFVGWEFAGRNGHVYEDGRVTEFIGTRHIYF